VFGISVVDWPSSVTLDRLAKGFEHFIRAGSRDDRGIAELIASLEIDIAVDLAGHTDRHRSRIFAYRPAPLVVNYLGYPGTTGSENIDYVMADAVVIPPENDRFFSERVVRLPNCFFPSDTGMPCLETGTRTEAGLPETGFVFCAFNNALKLSPEVFDVWMRLIQAIDGSVLWLNVMNQAARDNLRSEARLRGVPPERLVFAEREHFRLRHFARLRFADLHLDCLPYNAHSTATDSLLAGVPVLTCLGRSFAARVAGSMLTSIGMEELIARDLQEYETIALGLAQSPERLAALRGKLGRNRSTHPLFDMTRLARDIERAYEMMWKRHIEGQPPAGFAVPSL
jgi:predicted O-linked N-acetylglucosamine transferase (SPINDLY family)